MRRLTFRGPRTGRCGTCNAVAPLSDPTIDSSWVARCADCVTEGTCAGCHCAPGVIEAVWADDASVRGAVCGHCFHHADWVTPEQFTARNAPECSGCGTRDLPLAEYGPRGEHTCLPCQVAAGCASLHQVRRRGRQGEARSSMVRRAFPVTVTDLRVRPALNGPTAGPQGRNPCAHRRQHVKA